MSPSSLTLNPGETKSFTVSFTRTTATLNTYTGGQLTWSDGTHSVRSPIVIRPVALAAPAQVTARAARLVSGHVRLRRAVRGSCTRARSGRDGEADGAGRPDRLDVLAELAERAEDRRRRGGRHDVCTLLAVRRLHGNGADDIDLCVFLGTTQVGGSGSGTSAEEVNLVNPAAGTYTVVVQGWGTDGPDAQYTLFHWLLGSAAAGNMTVVAPSIATTGGTGTISLTFSGLTPATKYLGSVAYSGSDGLPNPTIVRVDTP